MLLAQEKKDRLQMVLKNRQVHNCIECGKCSSVCPLGRINREFYPRIIMRKALYEQPELIDDGLLWSCLNCGRCDEICDLDVRFYEFIQDLRRLSKQWGNNGVYLPHNGGLQAWMKMMTLPGVYQNRFDWIDSHLKTGETGDVLFFVGCLPYYDKFFENLKPNTLKIAKSTIKILNKLDIHPVLLKNERCCGHDFLWAGDIDRFKKVAQYNVDAIKKASVKKVVTSCAECYHTLKTEYPKHGSQMDVDVMHISELISENLPSLNLKNSDKKVSYQDPCRLGRLSGVYEQPRNVIKAIEGIELHEMDKNRSSGICCGTSGWLSCGTHSKQIQTARLKESKKTGAETLITCCPKCQIHFKCALSDKKTEEASKIEVEDLTTIVSDSLA